MIAGKEFCKFNYIVIALSHLSAINRNHIIVHPVFYRRYMITNSALRYFAFMMRKQ